MWTLRIRAFRLILGVCIGGTLFGATPRYKVSTIPLPTGLEGTVEGINNSGQIVIAARPSGSVGRFTLLFISTPSGVTPISVNPIPLPAGFVVGAVNGINDSGQVVGTEYNSGLPFVGTTSTLDFVPLPDSTQPLIAPGYTPTAINNLGQVTSTAYAGSSWKPFVGTTTGPPQPIPFPPGWLVEMTGINDSGQVVGFSTPFPQSPDPLARVHSFFFVGTAGGGITALPMPPGITDTGSAGPYLSNSGQVAGNGYNGVTNVPVIGTVGGLSSIPVPSGWSLVTASGINDSGKVVGVGCTTGNCPVGFIGDASGLTNLNDLMPPPWSIGQAIGINNKGQIAANGYDFSGVYRTLRLDPPCQVNVSFEVVSASMRASFTPPSDQTLSGYATACGFVGFNWRQTVTAFPCPNDMEPLNVAAAELPLSDFCPGSGPLRGITATVPFSDPVKGGYTNTSLNDMNLNAFPYYYATTWLLDDETFPNGICQMPPSDDCIPVVSRDGKALNFYDLPNNKYLPPYTFMGFTTSLVGIYRDLTYSAPLFHWSWTSTFNGTTGGVSSAHTYNTLPIDPGSGTGGITITSINDVQLPQVVPSNQITTTASGLAYSRVSQTFNGTVTIRNISGSAISGPFQIVFFGKLAGVTLVNATGNLSGTAYLTVPVGSLAPGQSTTVNVKFKNPSNALINPTPVVYAGIMPGA